MIEPELALPSWDNTNISLQQCRNNSSTASMVELSLRLSLVLLLLLLNDDKTWNRLMANNRRPSSTNCISFSSSSSSIPSSPFFVNAFICDSGSSMTGIASNASCIESKKRATTVRSSSSLGIASYRFQGKLVL